MKYYYTDPLAAAWMAKHFGMKWAGESVIDYYVSEREYGGHWSDSVNGKYYIHPSSVSI